MSDETPTQLPKRAFDQDAPSEQSGLGAFRARAERFALPAVLTLAVSAGLVFGGIAPKDVDTQTVTAAPAPAEVVERVPDRSSRADERPAGDQATPNASALPTAPSAAPAAPKALRAVSYDPNPAPASKTTSATDKLYATENVNVRAQASAGSDQIGSVQRGDGVSVTGRTDNGFSQVVLNGRNGWISSQYLSRTAPPKPAAPAPKQAAPANRAAAAPAAAAAPGGGRSCKPLPGLTSRAAAVHQALCSGFPAVTSYGGVRPDWDAEHPSGRAIDAMVSNTGTGDAVASWARANASRYGITEIIWNQRIWTSQRAGDGWRTMSDRGSATANHRDHVHISVG